MHACKFTPLSFGKKINLSRKKILMLLSHVAKTRYQRAGSNLIFQQQPGTEGREFLCPLCKASKITYMYLLTHMASVHYKKQILQYYDGTQRKCQICYKKFKTFSHLVIKVFSIRCIDRARLKPYIKFK